MQEAAAQQPLDEAASRVVEDPHRPGPSRARLDPEHIPVWAHIGQAKAISEARCAEMAADIVVLELAHDDEIAPAAVRVALDWYEKYPHAIDALLADNAAGFANRRAPCASSSTKTCHAIVRPVSGRWDTMLILPGS